VFGHGGDGFEKKDVVNAEDSCLEERDRIYEEGTYNVEAKDSEYISRPSSPASAYIVEAI
jgi:hypothetical protein